MQEPGQVLGKMFSRQPKWPLASTTTTMIVSTCRGCREAGALPPTLPLSLQVAHGLGEQEQTPSRPHSHVCLPSSAFAQYFLKEGERLEADVLLGQGGGGAGGPAWLAAFALWNFVWLLRENRKRSATATVMCAAHTGSQQN